MEILCVICEDIWYFNPSESSMKDLFLISFFYPPLFAVVSLFSPSILPRCFFPPPVCHIFSLLRTFFLLYSPSPSHRLLCGSLEVWGTASSSQLRWISCHGNQTQITNNGMLIMVITVWSLFQENERCYFSLEGLKKENVRGEAVWTT